MKKPLSGRAVKVLGLLELARSMSRVRKFGAWVPTEELVDKVGLHFAVGLIELDHKKHPENGAGFWIDRKPQEESDNYKYRLLEYPDGWQDWEDYNRRVKLMAKARAAGRLF